MSREKLKLRLNKSEDPRALIKMAKIRHLLWSMAGVNPTGIGPFVDIDGSYYLDFEAEFPLPFNVDDSLELTRLGVAPTEECANCGNRISPHLPTTCPNCNFRDIGPCPSCNQEIPRTRYVPDGGNSLHCCPNCNTRVRLSFNSPIWTDARFLNEPVILVTIAGSKIEPSKEQT